MYEVIKKKDTIMIGISKVTTRVFNINPSDMKKNKPIVKIDPSDGFVVRIYHSVVECNDLEWAYDIKPGESEDLQYKGENLLVAACESKVPFKGWYYRFLEDVVVAMDGEIQYIRGCGVTNLTLMFNLTMCGFKVWKLHDIVKIYKVYDLPGELWAPVDTMQNFQVSNLGRVKQSITSKPNPLTLFASNGWDLYPGGIEKLISFNAKGYAKLTEGTGKYKKSLYLNEGLKLTYFDKWKTYTGNNVQPEYLEL